MCRQMGCEDGELNDRILRVGRDCQRDLAREGWGRDVSRDGIEEDGGCR